MVGLDTGVFCRRLHLLLVPPHQPRMPLLLGAPRCASLVPAFNLSTALRQTWTGSLVGFLFWLWMPISTHPRTTAFITLPIPSTLTETTAVPLLSGINFSARLKQKTPKTRPALVSRRTLTPTIPCASRFTNGPRCSATSGKPLAVFGNPGWRHESRAPMRQES